MRKRRPNSANCRLSSNRRSGGSSGPSGGDGPPTTSSANESGGKPGRSGRPTDAGRRKALASRAPKRVDGPA
eukprot:8765671-Alexandrium_andersonii.AAC.1